MLPASRTTPEALDLQRLLNDMVDAGMDYAVVEVSSHALELERVVGCKFAGAVFTNITHEHLDFHHTIDNYACAKQKLFAQLDKDAYAVINMDDAFAGHMQEATEAEVFGYGTKESCQLNVRKYNSSMEGISATLNTPRGSFALHYPLVGEYNLYNILAAVGVALNEGISPEDISKGTANFKQVPGRFENIKNDHGFGIIVDYAHTDNALYNLLNVANKLCDGRLITIFGCGGERDTDKRSKMGAVAGALSDFSIVTTDNPRGEDPMQIINQVNQGIKKTVSNDNDYMICPDRFWAIHQAINMAKPGDLVVIAGKGHEDYQSLADKSIYFDDREVACQLLEQIC